MSQTFASNYYNDALREDLSLTQSNIAPRGVGWDAYASAGLGQLGSRTGGTATVGVDFFDSLTSRRLDTAVGTGNTRLTIGFGLGVFVTADTSGPNGGAAAGAGARGVLNFSWGSGAKPPELPKP